MHPPASDRPNIRPALPSDAGELQRLFAELDYPALTPQIAARLVAVLASENHALLVACQDTGRLAGCIHGVVLPILENDLTLQIMAMVVSADSRRCGIGTALVEAVESWGHHQGCAVTYVRCNAKRTQAHSFWQATGFTHAKTQFAFRKPVPSPTSATGSP
jgi:GNAT superfamily N-acetyltransferase